MYILVTTTLPMGVQNRATVGRILGLGYNVAETDCCVDCGKSHVKTCAGH